MSGSAHPTHEQLWLDEPSARHHVGGCAPCREARERARRRQRAVSDVLAGATPTATPMPETVERRLGAALRREMGGQGARTQLPTAVTRSSRRTSVWAGFAAAAAVLVLVGTVVGVQQTSDPIAGGSGDGETAAESGMPVSGTAEFDAQPAPPPVPPPLVEAAQQRDAGTADRAETACGVGVLDDPGDVAVSYTHLTLPTMSTTWRCRWWPED